MHGKGEGLVGERYRVARLAGELLEFCDRVERALGGRWSEANDQLRRAAVSALANVGEGLDETSLGDKKRFFRYAYRSCGECERCLRGLAVARALPTPLIEEGLRRFKDIKLDLNRLLAWARAHPR